MSTQRTTGASEAKGPVTLKEMREFLDQRGYTQVHHQQMGSRGEIFAFAGEGSEILFVLNPPEVKNGVLLYSPTDIAEWINNNPPSE